MNVAKHEVIIHTYDSSDETGIWSETYVIYNIVDDITYVVRVDQDGGETILDIKNGRGW